MERPSAKRQRSGKPLYIIVGGSSTILYRIDDPVEYLKSSSGEVIRDLKPTLVFSKEVLPRLAAPVKYESSIYFIGGTAAHVRNRQNKYHTVYVIDESVLNTIEPGENENNDGSKYLSTTTPLLSPMHVPLVFVAHGKLYAISENGQNFQVFYNSVWEQLPTANELPRFIKLQSHLLVDNTVYFSACKSSQQQRWDAIVSYDLQTGAWMPLRSYPIPGYRADPLVFSLCTQIVGNTVFGYIRHWAHRVRGSYFSIRASPLPQEESDRATYEFMKPSLSTNEALSQQLEAHRYKDVAEVMDQVKTEHLLTLDENLMCVVTYGSLLVRGPRGIPGPRGITESLFDSYLTLIFFEVDGVGNQFFKGTRRFQIRTTDLYIAGLLTTCLY